jgi:hypothetical protein
LFKLAKDRRGGGEFSQLAQKVPGAEGLMNNAPQSGGIMGAVGGSARAGVMLRSDKASAAVTDRHIIHAPDNDGD